MPRASVSRLNEITDGYHRVAGPRPGFLREGLGGLLLPSEGRWGVLLLHSGRLGRAGFGWSSSYSGCARFGLKRLKLSSDSFLPRSEAHLGDRCKHRHGHDPLLVFRKWVVDCVFRMGWSSRSRSIAVQDGIRLDKFASASVLGCYLTLLAFLHPFVSQVFAERLGSSKRTISSSLASCLSFSCFTASSRCRSSSMSCCRARALALIF